MLRQIISRPASVISFFIALCVTGVLLFDKVPVSLLPDVDVPRIVVRLKFPLQSAEEFEEQYVRNFRETFRKLESLSDMKSSSTAFVATIDLSFEYGTDMDKAFIEVNESIDRIVSVLPRNYTRPEVIRVSTGDVPVARLQIFSRDSIPMRELTQFATNVVGRQIAAIEGVGMIDVNGTYSSGISIRLLPEVSRTLDVSNEHIERAFSAARKEVRGIEVANGNYIYTLDLGAEVVSLEDIRKIPVPIPAGGSVMLGQLAEVFQVDSHTGGFHIFNGRDAIVLAIHKQQAFGQHRFIDSVRKATSVFQNEYPGFSFTLTQDQSYVLNAGIDNMVQEVLFGTIATVILLFFFVRGWRTSLLMAVSIPLSLVMGITLFYLLGVSFNIVSLSGLALGVGMLIDNSIVVIDSIARRRQEGLSLSDSCVSGTSRVIVPVVSQVLTTVAVYLPLVLLNGIAGALVSEQSIALTIVLAISLLVAFVLTPFLYCRIFPECVESIGGDTRFFIWLSKIYQRVVDFVIRRKAVSLLFSFFVLCAGVACAYQLEVRALPDISSPDGLLKIDWKDASVSENKERTLQLYNYLGQKVSEFEAEVGVSQFVNSFEMRSLEHVEVYFKLNDIEDKTVVKKMIAEWFRMNHPSADWRLFEAPNAFTKMFIKESPEYEYRVRYNPQESVTWKGNATDKLSYQVLANLDMAKIRLYDIDLNAVFIALSEQYGTVLVGNIERFGTQVNVSIIPRSVFTLGEIDGFVRSRKGAEYPLSAFVQFGLSTGAHSIRADLRGRYFSYAFDSQEGVSPVIRELVEDAKTQGANVELVSKEEENKAMVGQLVEIFIIVLLLLYLILAFQYESFSKAVDCNASIPFGLAGSIHNVMGDRAGHRHNELHWFYCCAGFNCR